MNIYRAMQTKKSTHDDAWWDTLLSTLTLILSLSSQLKETPHYHAEIQTATHTLRSLIKHRLQSYEVKKRTSYLIQHEVDVLTESIRQTQQLVLHPAYQAQLKILVNHADRLVDALMTYDVGDVSKKYDEINAMKRSDDLHHSSSFNQFDTVGRKLMKTISSLRPIQQQQQQQHENSHYKQKDRRQLNVAHERGTTKTSIINLFTSRKSSRSSLKELFNQHQHKKRDPPDHVSATLAETLLPGKLYDSFYYNHSDTPLHSERRQIKGRRSSPAMSSLISSPPTVNPTHMIHRQKSQHSFAIPEHYYDDPFFFNDSPLPEQPNKINDSNSNSSSNNNTNNSNSNSNSSSRSNSSKASTICSSDSSYFSAKSSSLHSINESTNFPRPQTTEKPFSDDINTTTDAAARKMAIRQLSGPPPLHQPGQSRKSREKDGSPLYHVYDKNGQQIMVLEILAGKPKVVAATREQLFLKLADESPQDLDYVDVYLLNHASFTTSSELVDNLIARFHLEPCPGQQDYFHQWQRRIQIKTLRVITRWIKLQCQDFKHNPSLLLRLEKFCDQDLVMEGFVTEAAMIKDAIYAQTSGYQNHHDSSPCPSHSTTPLTTLSSSSSRHISGGTTPPDSPLLSAHSVQYYHHHPHSTNQPSHHYHHQRNNVVISPFLSLDTKDIAKYLTLADYHLLKQIKPRDYLDGHWRDTPYNDLSLTDIESRYDYIGIMTKRANMMNHWVIHELASAKSAKQRRMILRKLIETSKLCLEWNNFHTSMVLTMGLLSHPVQKMTDTWQSLPNRDKTTFSMLEKLVDVSHNMAHYRQALKEDGHLYKKQDPFSPVISKSGSVAFRDATSFLSLASYTPNNASSLPTLLFFPMVLKDLTFLMDGNSTIYGQHDDTHPNDDNIHDYTLINFAKFSGLAHYVTKVVQSSAVGTYWFAMDRQPPCCCYHEDSSGPPYSPTRSSISTSSTPDTPHHYIYQQHYQNSSKTHLPPVTLSTSLSATTTAAPSLDLVADMVEERIFRVATCYGDPQCEAHLAQVLKSTL